MALRTFGRYTHAIVRRVPDSFVNAIGASEPINLHQARVEHANYIANLRDLGTYLQKDRLQSIVDN